MHSNKIIHIMLAAALAFSPVAVSATDLTVTAGQLGDLLAKTEITDGTVALTGTLDVRDLMALSALQGVESIDMSATDIVAYTSQVPIFMNRSQFNAEELPAYIFFGTNVSSFILPESLRIIAEGAFASSAVEEIALPMRVSTVGNYAFKDCKNLSTIGFNTQLRNLGEAAFDGCVSLETVNLSFSRVTDISNRCFAGDKSLREVLLPTDITRIGEYVFANTAIQELDIKGASEFGNYAFADMPLLEKITGTSPVTGVGAFMCDTLLTTVPTTPAHLPDLYFANCHVISLDNNTEHLQTLGKMSLADSSIGKLVLGENVSYIDSEALSGVKEMSHINVQSLHANVPAIADDAFDGINQNNVELLVEPGTESAWQGADGWNKFRIVTTLTGINEAIADSEGAYEVALVGTLLKVAAPDDVLIADIYTLDGKIAAHAEPNESMFAIDLGSISRGGVLIVNLKTAESTYTCKVLY